MTIEKKLTIDILDTEYWYGPVVHDGYKYPLHNKSCYEANLEPSHTPNQVNPLLISTKGRVIWCESGFMLKVENGQLDLISTKEEPKLYQMGSNLKEAFKAVAQAFFKPNGIVPPEDFFTKPQYNTWIELLYNQNQEDVLKYARTVIEKGMPVGIIMIDDGWSDYYGKWEFNEGKFPDPKAMIDELHQLGFKVMLWTCPFITPDTIIFRELKSKGYLVKNQDGNTAIKSWWNGYSAVLDLTHPEAVAWYHARNHHLMDTYGVDGFKFDAGDAHFYAEEDVTYAPIDPNGQSELWAKIGMTYEYNEYRACFKVAGQHLVQRLADKNHSWEMNGLATLIPNQLAQGILGYAYTCPDMIGGGEYMNFLANSDKLDKELFVRYAQCAALMPMMQFSAAPWRVLDEAHFEHCKEAAWTHVAYQKYIYRLAKEASRTGEPIVRYMSYEFPNEGLEEVIDQFMLGEKYLVAPQISQGKKTREIIFPTGKWVGKDEEIIEGPIKLEVEVALDYLPIYKKLER